MKKICFIANGGKTILYKHLAEKLLISNIDVYWIVTNRKNYNYLLGYYDKSKILYLPMSIADDFTSISSSFQYEIKLNELVWNDRALKYNKERGVQYLTCVLVLFSNFIDKNTISFVFGELTYAHEVAIFRLSKVIKDYIFLIPQRIRIPSNRFAFFTDEYQSVFLERRHDFEPYEEIELKKPDYIQITKERVERSFSFRSRIKKVFNLISNRNYDKNDPIHYKGNFQRIFYPINTEINRETYRFINFNKDFDYKNKQFFLYTLHKQPESSIDNLGRYYENQKTLIENIWRILPTNSYLVVKEHIVSKGDRPYKFYKELSSLPNIVIYENHVGTHELLKYAKAVFSVSGTIAYEAGLLGVPAFVFAPVFFRLSTVQIIDYNHFRKILNWKEFIQKIKTEIDMNKDNEIKKWIFRNSFLGNVSCPLNDEKSISNENVKKLTYAFLNVLT